MQKANKIKKISILLLLACMISTFSYHSAAFMTVSASEITPKSDDIRWRYKTVNGITYKRLFNYTTRTWIGDWIPV